MKTVFYSHIFWIETHIFTVFFLQSYMSLILDMSSWETKAWKCRINKIWWYFYDSQGSTWHVCWWRMVNFLWLICHKKYIIKVQRINVYIHHLISEYTSLYKKRFLSVWVAGRKTVPYTAYLIRVQKIWSTYKQ